MSTSARQHPLSLHMQHVPHDFKVLEFTGDEAISTGGAPVPGTPASPLIPGEVEALHSLELAPATQMQALQQMNPACPQCEALKPATAQGVRHVDA